MGDRFGTFVKAARTCYRGAGAIDSAEATIAEVSLELADDPSAAQALEDLRLAHLALVRARASLGEVLKSKVLKPESREAGFWGEP